MRFQRYLNETTEVTDEEVIDILTQGFQKFAKVVNKLKYKFSPMMLYALNKIFEPLNVGFRLTKSQYMSGGTDVHTRKINLSITPQQLESLKTNDGIMAYGNNIIGILTHELTHKKQIERIPKSKRDKIFRKELFSKSDAQGYFSSKDEIEAYARQAAYELSNLEKSDIINMYKKMFKGSNNKIWERFMKKLYHYLPETEKNIKIEV